jgi:hypothetical protein
MLARTDGRAPVRWAAAFRGSIAACIFLAMPDMFIASRLGGSSLNRAKEFI